MSGVRWDARGRRLRRGAVAAALLPVVLVLSACDSITDPEPVESAMVLSAQEPEPADAADEGSRTSSGTTRAATELQIAAPMTSAAGYSLEIEVAVVPSGAPRWDISRDAPGFGAVIWPAALTATVQNTTVGRELSLKIWERETLIALVLPPESAVCVDGPGFVVVPSDAVPGTASPEACLAVIARNRGVSAPIRLPAGGVRALDWYEEGGPGLVDFASARLHGVAESAEIQALSDVGDVQAIAICATKGDLVGFSPTEGFVALREQPAPQFGSDGRCWIKE